MENTTLGGRDSRPDATLEAEELMGMATSKKLLRGWGFLCS